MSNANIVAVLTDLMFMVKVQAAAAQIHQTVTFVKSKTEALSQAEHKPSLIVIDLNFAAADPIGLIATLKSNDALKSIALLGFVSHVDAALVQAARENSCDSVVARSTFAQNLPALLANHCIKKQKSLP